MPSLNRGFNGDRVTEPWNRVLPRPRNSARSLPSYEEHSRRVQREFECHGCAATILNNVPPNSETLSWPTAPCLEALRASSVRGFIGLGLWNLTIAFRGFTASSGTVGCCTDSFSCPEQWPRWDISWSMEEVLSWFKGRRSPTGDSVRDLEILIQRCVLSCFRGLVLAFSSAYTVCMSISLHACWSVVVFKASFLNLPYAARFDRGTAVSLLKSSILDLQSWPLEAFARFPLYLEEQRLSAFEFADLSCLDVSCSGNTTFIDCGVMLFNLYWMLAVIKRIFERILGGLHHDLPLIFVCFTYSFSCDLWKFEAIQFKTNLNFFQIYSHSRASKDLNLLSLVGFTRHNFQLKYCISQNRDDVCLECLTLHHGSGYSCR